LPALTLTGKDIRAIGFAALMAKGSRERIDALFSHRISFASPSRSKKSLKPALSSYFTARK
jgi:hypothetical protein